MPFMVIYRTSDGAPCYEQADAIDEAALFVERLRNQDGIDDHIRIYRMEEISFAFRPYYKVELGLPDRPGPARRPESATDAAPPAAIAAPADVSVAPAPEATAPEAPTRPELDAPDAGPTIAPGLSTSPAEVDGDETANGRRGLFGR